MTIRTILLLAIVILGASTLLAQDNANTTAIKAVIDRMTAAQTAFDSADLERILTPDFIEISPVGEFDPRDKVLSFYSDEEKARSNGVSVTITKYYRSIRIYGSTAVAIVEFTYAMSSAGKTMPPQKMMVTIVGRKARGNWLIASTHYTGIRSPKPSAPSSR